MQDQEQHQGVVADEAEPFMGAGRFGMNNFFHCNFTRKNHLPAYLRGFCCV